MVFFNKWVIVSLTSVWDEEQNRACGREEDK